MGKIAIYILFQYSQVSNSLVVNPDCIEIQHKIDDVNIFILINLDDIP